MRRPSLLLSLLLLLAGASIAPARAGAQRRAGVEVALPPRERLADEGPTVRAAAVLREDALRDLVRSGFPARLHFRVELWSDEGWVNDLRGTREWDVIVRFDPLDATYRVYLVVGEQPPALIGRSARWEDARDVAERAMPAPLWPRRPGKYYYLAVLDVETLSLGDLDELERWLRGELKPAIRQPGRTGGAIARGAGTLFARLLGGDRRHYESRSPGFTIR